MRSQGTQTKSELQMGIELMFFSTLVGRSTSEPSEFMGQARARYWVMTHGLYHTVTRKTLVCHARNDRFLTASRL